VEEFTTPVSDRTAQETVCAYELSETFDFRLIGA
jgi:hypothetical protein